MAKPFIPIRANFPPGAQRMFIDKSAARIGRKKIATVARVSVRTVSDWRWEKTSIPLQTVGCIAQASGMRLPKVGTRDLHSHLASIAKKGAEARTQKYGSLKRYERKRRKHWKAWWETEGKYTLAVVRPKQIRTPIRNEKLAEFIGIMVGDGTIASYHTAISLNRETDAAYILFVTRLIRELFHVIPSVYRDKHSLASDIVVHRKTLVEFCIAQGLPKGDKIRARIDMPAWIRIHIPYAIACIRGLIDTDGCVVIHRYRVKGKQYVYKKLLFTSASMPLMQSMYECLTAFGMRPRLYKQRNLWLDSAADVATYFSVVGTHNPKHLKRYRN